MSLRRTVGEFYRILRDGSRTLNRTKCQRAINSGKNNFLCQNSSQAYTWTRTHGDNFHWILVSGQAVLFLGLSSNSVLAEDVSTELTESDASGTDFNGLQKVDDGSLVSNIHTSKWRVFTDNGRDLFLQGKLDDAERLFVGALQEAKEGFGERDPHVASSCNNLAELYRVKKAFDKAEPLYLEAISILEESYGHEDIRVGAALHNLGQFYLVQRKLEEARACYERALKIKRRILGEGHADYAETMYHLGKVLHLQGKGKDSEALIEDSIRILEEGGQGDSFLCIRRLRHLVQIYTTSNKLTDAVNVQRKILHKMEVSKEAIVLPPFVAIAVRPRPRVWEYVRVDVYQLSVEQLSVSEYLHFKEELVNGQKNNRIENLLMAQGWDSLETVIAAEGLALTLQSVGGLKEAQELLERCLHSRRRLLSEDHIQIAANMLHMARVQLLLSKQPTNAVSVTNTELDKAKDLLENAIRLSRRILDKLTKQRANHRPNDVARANTYDERTALLILLQALNALGQLEMTEVELQERRVKQENPVPLSGAENALLDCIAAYKEFGNRLMLSNSPDIKAEYLSCLKRLSPLLSKPRSGDLSQSKRRPTLQELENEIKRVEGELTPNRKA